MRAGPTKTILSLMLSVILFTTGCARSGAGESGGAGSPAAGYNDDAQSPIGDVRNPAGYAGQYQKIILPDGDNLGRLKSIVHEDFLYLYLLSRSETDGSAAAFISQIDTKTGTQKDFMRFPLPETVINYDICFDDAGNVRILAEYFDNDSISNILYTVSPAAQLLSENDITALLRPAEGPNMRIRGFYSDRTGNMYLLAFPETELSADTENSETASPYVVVIGPDGTVKDKIGYEQPEFCDGFELKYDGNTDNVYLAVTQGSLLTLDKVDLATHTLIPEIELELFGGFEFTVHDGSDSVILRCDHRGISEYDIRYGQNRPVLQWTESDVIMENALAFGAGAEGGYWVLNEVRKAGGPAFEFITLLPITGGQYQDREIITFGSIYGSGSELSKAIVRFNQSNRRYRIRIIDYGSDSETARTRFYADLAAGNVDIIDLSVDTGEFRQLLKLGALEDLSPYLEQEEEFSPGDYQEQSLTVYEENDKLYGVMAGFGISVLAGAADKLGHITQLKTVVEIISLAERYPEVRLREGDDNLGILSFLLAAAQDEFVNIDTGQCDFTNDEFIRILEFTKNYAAGSGSKDGMINNNSNAPALLKEWVVFTVWDIRLLEIDFRNPVTFIGYPDQASGGINFVPYASAGISAGSGHKDGAWEFIRFLLSEDYQQEIADLFASTAIPVKKSAIDARCEQSEELLELYSDGQINQYRELINITAGLPARHSEQQIDIIVEEETAAFFAGQKTVAETAAIIENRVAIFISENQ